MQLHIISRNVCTYLVKCRGHLLLRRNRVRKTGLRVKRMDGQVSANVAKSSLLFFDNNIKAKKVHEARSSMLLINPHYAMHTAMRTAGSHSLRVFSYISVGTTTLLMYTYIRRCI